MKHFFKESKLLLGTVALAWLLAISFYYLSGRTDIENTERRVDPILQRLSEAYTNGSNPEIIRHIVIANFLNEQATTLREGAFLHLAISFFVAGMLILGVEGLSRYRTTRELKEQADETRKELKEHTEEVSRAVWNAIFHRFIPKELSSEVECIFKSTVYRVSPHYLITFPRDAYREIPEGYVVVRRQVHYHVVNLMAERTDWTFALRVMSHTGDFTLKNSEGADVALPAINSVSIGGAIIDIGKRPKEFTHIHSLTARGLNGDSTQVLSEAEELLGVNDRATYILTTPSVGLEVTIINELTNVVEVQGVYLSSGRDRMEQTTRNTWKCSGAVLGGVALVVSWRKATPSLHAGQVIEEPYKPVA